MPWTVDRPPTVARNWSDEEKRRCVEAANAVLEETGDEERAIFACIRAAGRSERGGDMDETKVEESERERLRREKEARAKRYGIAPKEGKPLTPPKGYPENEEEYGDPVNYAYPIDDEHIRAAVAYFNHEGQREDGGYTTEEWAIIGKRIARAATRLLDAKYEYRDGKVVRAEEDKSAVKVLGRTDDVLRVGGWGIVFGGRDLQGDTFTPEVEIGLDWWPAAQPPVFYEHGRHAVIGPTKLGNVRRIEKRDVGYWVEAELDRHQRYVRDIEVLIDACALGWSSGAVAHLVERDGGVIRRWPVYEFSLTPTPAEPRTLGVQALKSLADAAGIG
jgi:hypothetical protein